MIGEYRVHGHAIVSEDNRISSGDGTRPRQLRGPAGRARLQAAQDGAVVTVLGRRAHRMRSNASGGNRLVVSSKAKGVEHHDGAWWWNPRETPAEDALRRAAPGGGVAVVFGGRRLFDIFLVLGFDEFHLARAKGVHVPDGVPVFSAVAQGFSPEEVLARHGLTAGPSEVLDPDNGLSVVVWRRNGDPA